MEKLFIEAKREAYTPENCGGNTMTVRQLIDALQDGIDDCSLDEDMPVYISNDYGYTFGRIWLWSFSTAE